VFGDRVDFAVLVRVVFENHTREIRRLIEGDQGVVPRPWVIGNPRTFVSDECSEGRKIGRVPSSCDDHEVARPSRHGNEKLGRVEMSLEEPDRKGRLRKRLASEDAEIRFCGIRSLISEIAQVVIPLRGAVIRGTPRN